VRLYRPSCAAVGSSSHHFRCLRRRRQCRSRWQPCSSVPLTSSKRIYRASLPETAIRNTCRELNIAAIVDSAYKTPAHLYNAALVINAKGELVERYAKVYLASEKWFTPGYHIGAPSTSGAC
jgi:hypothetical protein